MTIAISAQRPASLPSPAILRRRCVGLARLDRALARARAGATGLDDDELPTHDFDGRRGVFCLREAEGDHVWIAFARAGVLIIGFAHESPMSPVHHDERTWPGVLDAVPAPLRRARAGYPFGVDATFCIWRLAGARRWQTGEVTRPRGRDVDGSARLLAILDGDPRRYQRFAQAVHERDVPLAVIARAYAGGTVDARALSAVTAAAAPTPRPARTPANQPRARARFAIGDRVIDRWDERGTITAIWPSLADGARAAEIRDVDGWLRGLRIAPKTPRRGFWYSVRPRSGGAALCGERDLRPAT